MTGFMTASEAAVKWNISHRRVITLCNENRIEGVGMLGKMWIIPVDAEKPIDARTTRYDETVNAKPFLKWAGGKGQLLDTLRTYYPEGLGTTITKYCEPMVGAGAVLFDILNNYDLEEILISDSNAELINTYNELKKNASELIQLLQQFENAHIAKVNEDRKEYYYSQREMYNSLIEKKNANATLKAALFIYLNKTCFNGLYRVNRHGQFNVPMGSYSNPTICDIENLLLVAKKLEKVKIISGDYKQTEKFIDDKTFVYFDPPYRPLSKTAEFTSYTEAEFNDNNQIELAEFIKMLVEKGAKVLASNSDPKNTNPDDNFFDDLYKQLKIERVSAKRAINSKGSKRGTVSELLICNY
ncbi:MAG: Dam family site-specific DNA-(adenine-N6)-methyltransferase [Clostridia bacterium]|nr:Dam family site-specific DNA-(adenine-N6)-methyltransferase [Clostridia bacterium]